MCFVGQGLSNKANRQNDKKISEYFKVRVCSLVLLSRFRALYIYECLIRLLNCLPDSLKAEVQVEAV